MTNDNRFIKIGKVQGFEEINKKLEKLKELGIKPKHEVKIFALNAGAKVLKDETKAQAPSRQSGVMFGRSKKSVRNATKKAVQQKVRRGGNVAGNITLSFATLKTSIGSKFSTGASRNSLSIRVLTHKPTGHLIEFGHKTRQGTGKAKNYKPKPGGKAFIAARPFMQPSIEAKQDDAVDRVAEVINKNLDKLIAA